MFLNIFKMIIKEPLIKILVACHKADTAIRSDNIYAPIHVGKDLHPDIDLGFPGDNIGDNISSKNPTYCELTALYWAWKNLSKDIDIVGLAHYRRYLKIKVDNLKKLISNNYFIIPKPNILAWSVGKELALWTSQEDVYILISILKKKYPSRGKIIDNFFFKTNRFYRLNMFISSYKNFNEYCNFIFDILFDFEQYSRNYPFSRQQRLLGYIGELLMGLWIKFNNIKVSEKYVEGVENPKTKDHIKNIINDMAFFLTRPRHIYYDPTIINGLKQDNITLFI